MSMMAMPSAMPEAMARPPGRIVVIRSIIICVVARFLVNAFCVHWRGIIVAVILDDPWGCLALTLDDDVALAVSRPVEISGEGRRGQKR
jgi:hypothetical protein